MNNLNNKKNNHQEQGFAILGLIMIILLLVGVVAGIYLVKNPQILKSKASSEVLKFSGPGVTQKTDGTYTSTGFSVNVQIQSPKGAKP